MGRNFWLENESLLVRYIVLEKMAEIPGYWRDPNTGKYFKIGPGFSPPKLGFGKPKTLSELHPINCKPTNRNSSTYTGNNFRMSDSEFGGHTCPSTKACPRVFALSLREVLIAHESKSEVSRNLYLYPNFFPCPSNFGPAFFDEYRYFEESKRFIFAK